MFIYDYPGSPHGWCNFYCGRIGDSIPPGDPPATGANVRRSYDGPDPDEVGPKATLDQVVKLSTRGATLGAVGALLADVTDAEIYVPADRIDERQEDLYLEDVTLDAVIRSFRLMAVVRP
jgi:hypothetical protein